MKKVPTDKRGWINYRGRVFIIACDEEGKTACYQYNGCSCFQGVVTGFLKHAFNSNLKWFSREIWYKCTGWGNNFPKELVFSSQQTDKIWHKYMPNGWLDTKITDFDNSLNNIHNEVTPLAIKTDTILNDILREVRKKTRFEKYEFDFTNTEYAVHWYEAHIPLTDGKNKFILTWENCD